VIAMGTPHEVQTHPEVVRAYIGGDLEGGGMTEPLLRSRCDRTFYGPIQSIRECHGGAPRQIVMSGVRTAPAKPPCAHVSGILDPEGGKVVFEGKYIAHMAPIR